MCSLLSLIENSSAADLEKLVFNTYKTISMVQQTLDRFPVSLSTTLVHFIMRKSSDIEVVVSGLYLILILKLLNPTYLLRSHSYRPETWRIVYLYICGSVSQGTRVVCICPLGHDF